MPVQLGLQCTASVHYLAKANVTEFILNDSSSTVVQCEMLLVGSK